MPQPPLSRTRAEEAVNAVSRRVALGASITGEGPSAYTLAAEDMNIDTSTLMTRIRSAKRLYGLDVQDTPLPEDDTPEIAILKLKDDVRTLRAALQSAQREDMTRAAISKRILGIADADPNPPKWALDKPKKGGGVIGVPILFASDWHWGEVVQPSEIGYANDFNIEIAHARARRLINTAVSLLFEHMANPNYPGIVFALGGDLVTGTIHEELTATNDRPIMPTVLDLLGVLIWCVETLKAKFGKVFIPGVAGNHGRLTQKTVAKERAHTNWDWLICKLLEQRFQGDKDVQFLIPDGPDCHFRVYGHRYLLTHGDQFKGGNGIAGSLMPIERGRHKKSTREISLDRHFDTMILGHFHQLMQLPHLIVNGSLKGLDEWAFQMNFGFERPAQALWITHPENGITFQMPIYLDDAKREGGAWVAAFEQ